MPGIRYVVDPGTARISRYSHRHKVQRLPIEPISQASANQRKGRCGRVADGICIRLYSEDDFEARPEFTEPEILRTNLASVILQMTALGLGDVAGVPVRRPAGPAQRSPTASQLLEELGALDPPDRPAQAAHRRSAASSPSCRSTRGWPGWCSRPTATAASREVLVIAAALSIQDPRERPVEQQQAADAEARPVRRHRLRLPHLPQPVALPARAAEASCRRSAFRRLCRAEFLNYLRVREWQDLLRPAAAGGARRWASTLSTARRTTRIRTVHTVAARRAALAHRDARTPTSGEYLGRARRPVRDLPRLGAVQEAAALGDGRRAGGDVPAVGAGSTPGSSRSGSSRWPGTWSSARYSEPHWEQDSGAGDGATRR